MGRVACAEEGEFAEINQTGKKRLWYNPFGKRRMSESMRLQGSGYYSAEDSPDLGEDWESDRHIHGASRRRWYEHAHVWRPPTDVYESEAGYVIRVELAGMRSADFSVTLEGRWLHITGARPDEAQHRAYHQMEIHFGPFRSEVEIPGEVDSQRLEAVYEDGFLIVTLPKVKPRVIPISS
jgi:HSP20 family protein